MMNRRDLFRSTLALSSGALLRQFIPARAEETKITEVKLSESAPVPIAEDFIGLGYEMSSVARRGLLVPENRQYVELVRGLGTKGVIRVGGIVADYSRYDANGISKFDKQDTVITQANLLHFRRFLDAVGWTAIWSVNFAKGTLEDAVAEARAVSEILGERLLAIEIGNEVENYGRGQKPFRSPPYTYDNFREEYSKWHAAIAAVVPSVKFAAPDTAGSIDWVEKMAADAKGDVQLLTIHYYRGNQSRGSADQLIASDPHLAELLMRMHAASGRSGIPWRLCETNSFSGGGRHGVSDSFLGTLWTLDFLLQLAAGGCSGVNIETGVNQLGFLSYYSPIRNDDGDMAQAGVPYYGMLAFAFARRGCSQVIPIELTSQTDHLTVYALGANGKPRSIVAINRNADQDASISLVNLNLRKPRLFRLSAPSIESTSGTTFAGEVVNQSGQWSAHRSEQLRSGVVSVPRASAVVVCSNQ